MKLGVIYGFSSFMPAATTQQKINEIHGDSGSCDGRSTNFLSDRASDLYSSLL